MFSTERLIFKTCPLAQITTSHSYYFLPSNGPAYSSWSEPTKCIWLPQYSEAKPLLERYLNDLSHAHHVIHGPTIRQQVDEIYRYVNDLNQDQRKVIPEHVALLLAIISSTIHVQPISSTDTQTAIFITSTFTVLNHCKMSGPGSLEEIQAMIITSFVTTHLEGLSRRFWSLLTDAILIGRALGLQRIDSDYYEVSKSLGPITSVKAEMGRRVWWYLTASDWYALLPRII